VNVTTRQTLRRKVNEKRGLLVPGAFNAMSARIIADQGFEAVYLTGAGLTNMYYGLPDLAFIGLRDVADHTARIREAVEIPLIVDADTGFGNALNVRHTVKTLSAPEPTPSSSRTSCFPSAAGTFPARVSRRWRRWWARSRLRSTRERILIS